MQSRAALCPTRTEENAGLGEASRRLEGLGGGGGGGGSGEGKQRAREKDGRDRGGKEDTRDELTDGEKDGVRDRVASIG
jgi:hypothetical protein